MFRNKFAIVILLVIALALTGCFKKSDPNELKSIAIDILSEDVVTVEEEESKIVLIGKTQAIKLKAVGRNAKGQPLELKDIKWSVSDEAVGKLDSDNKEEVTFTGAGQGGKLTVTVEGEKDISASVDLVALELIHGLVPGYPFKDQADGFTAGNLAGNQDPRGYPLEKIASSWNDTGHWIEWEISVPEDGEYFFVMRFAVAQGPGEPRLRDLKLMDGENVKEVLLDRIELHPIEGISTSFGRQAEGWDFYISEEPIALTKGDNQVFRMENIGGDREGVNVAWLGFVIVDPEDLELTTKQFTTLIDKELDMPFVW